MKKFRTLRLSAEFYRLSRSLVLPKQLSDQLERAASSISLNLAEGYGRVVPKEQNYFFRVAMGSLRECQAILMLAGAEHTPLWASLDSLGAHLFCLLRKIQQG